MFRITALSVAFFSLFAVPVAFAGSSEMQSEQPSVDKSLYNLFHPTPDNLLRPYSADRPSQSTGPYTVDAGHFYFEASAVSYLFDESDGVRTRQWNVLPFNFRMGLTNNVELDLSYGDYFRLHLRDRAAGVTEMHNGFGDLVVQSKINLIGNDSGRVAFGLIPFLKFPTNTNGLGNDSIEGGLGLPLQIALPGGFSLGLETGVNFIRNSADTGYDPAFFNAIVVGHSLFSDKLTGYVEFYDVANTSGDASNAAYIDAGLVYQIFPNAEIDLGCNFGVTDAATDFQPFTGFSFRF
jgi:hypothetical protein